MLQADALLADLAAAGFPDWCTPVHRLIEERLREGVHGQLGEWNELLRNLPDFETEPPVLHDAIIRVGAPGCDADDIAVLRRQLIRLAPWRKGPFHVCGVDIDSEWRSDMKWSRIVPAISDLRGRLVLDVGCGNGYYALRMRGLGARFVLGIDPAIQYLAQFLAIQHFARQSAVHVLPLRLADLPPHEQAFDTTFSMGVLYHRRDPEEHLRQLRRTLKPGGELVLETLILPGETAAVVTPPGRYARMRNVWHLPTLPQLRSWLEDSGFAGVRVADVSVTTSEEQRTTEWMPFESLEQALDPANPELTVEGWPRPRRAVLVARALT